MPWYAIKSPAQCPAAKPWAVKNKNTGRLMGCHASKAKAMDQVQALYANVKMAEEMSAEDGAKMEVDRDSL